MTFYNRPQARLLLNRIQALIREGGEQGRSHGSMSMLGGVTGPAVFVCARRIVGRRPAD